MNIVRQSRLEKARELSSVLILALGFGLVGIDRFLIVTLFPVISQDLRLDYGDVGIITGALALAWGVAALLMGNVADRIGRRRVLVGSLIAFSMLIGASGLATGLMGLVLIRVVMGLADGAYTPASISATIAASPPQHQGRNIGIQQMTLTLFGLGLAPLLVSSLLHVINWRWIFSIFLGPGLLLAWATSRTISGRPSTGVPGEGSVSGRRSLLEDWQSILRYRNIPILMLCMLCWLTCLITTSALLPGYLIDFLGLTYGQMGTVMSAIGFGAAAGTLLLPWFSDRVGRRRVMVLGALGVLVALLLLVAIDTRAVAILFLGVFAVHFFNNALITLTVGPMCTATVPPELMATASGMVIAAGELFGGGFAPIVAGQIALQFGIDHLLVMPMVAIAIGLLLVCLLEDAPIGSAAADPTATARANSGARAVCSTDINR